jgi:hypothetical protein
VLKEVRILSTLLDKGINGCKVPSWQPGAPETFVCKNQEATAQSLLAASPALTVQSGVGRMVERSMSRA